MKENPHIAEDVSVNESMGNILDETATLLYSAATALDSQWCEKDTSRLREVAKAFEDPKLCCSFCGRSVEDVYKLVAARHASICNACVALSTNILIETPRDETKSIVGARFEVFSSEEDLQKFQHLVKLPD